MSKVSLPYKQWFFFRDLCFLPLIYMSLLMPLAYGFNYNNFVIQLESRNMVSPALLLLLKIASVIQKQFFVVSYKFQGYFSYFYEKSQKNFDRNYIKSVCCLSQYGHLTSNLLIHEHKAAFHLFLSSSVSFRVIVFSIQVFCFLG